MPYCMRQFQPRFADIFKIALPISFSLLIPQVSFVANTLFVAHLGYEGLSVLGMVGVYYLLLTWMGYGLSNGLLVLLSRSAGQNDTALYGRTFQNGMIVGLFFMLALLGLSYGFGGFFYSHSLDNADLIAGSTQFLHYRLLGFPFLIFNQLFNVFLISTGRTMWLLIGSVVGNAVNILLDYVLIFGNWGMPEMGVNGAAVGSAVGELAYFLVMLAVIIGKNWHRMYQLFEGFKKDLLIIREIVRMASPLVLQYIFSIGGWQVYYIYMEHLGREQVAATHILRNAIGIIGIGSWALASTSNTLVGNLVGQGRYREVMKAVGKIVAVSGIYGSTVAILLYLFKDALIGYYTDDPKVIGLIFQGLEVVYGSAIVICIATVLFNAIIGLGRTRMSMVFEVSCVTVYVLYLTMVVKWLNLDFFWAWTSEYAYWGLLAIFSGFYLLLGKWKRYLAPDALQR